MSRVYEYNLVRADSKQPAWTWRAFPESEDDGPKSNVFRFELEIDEKITFDNFTKKLNENGHMIKIRYDSQVDGKPSWWWFDRSRYQNLFERQGEALNLPGLFLGSTLGTSLLAGMILVIAGATTLGIGFLVGFGLLLVGNTIAYYMRNLDFEKRMNSENQSRNIVFEVTNDAGSAQTLDEALQILLPNPDEKSKETKCYLKSMPCQHWMSEANACVEKGEINKARDCYQKARDVREKNNILLPDEKTALQSETNNKIIIFAVSKPEEENVPMLDAIRAEEQNVIETTNPESENHMRAKDNIKILNEVKEGEKRVIKETNPNSKPLGDLHAFNLHKGKDKNKNKTELNLDKLSQDEEGDVLKKNTGDPGPPPYQRRSR